MPCPSYNSLLLIKSLGTHLFVIKYWIVTYLVARKALRLSLRNSRAVVSVGENDTRSHHHFPPPFKPEVTWHSGDTEPLLMALKV